MWDQAEFFDLDKQSKMPSTKDGALERLAIVADFEPFCPTLAHALSRSESVKGDRPPFDLVFMFKVRVIQASHSLSDEWTESLIKDRLSFMRFCTRTTSASSVAKGRFTHGLSPTPRVTTGR